MDSTRLLLRRRVIQVGYFNYRGRSGSVGLVDDRVAARSDPGAS